MELMPLRATSNGRHTSRFHHVLNEKVPSVIGRPAVAQQQRTNTTKMNSRKLITSFAAIALIGGLGIGIARAEDDDDQADQAKLAAEAKVTKEQAQATALKEVPNGTIKEAEIENEKGRLIWSFDLTTPGTTDTTEVNVDAQTGKVVGIEHEKADDDEKGGKEEKDDDKD